MKIEHIRHKHEDDFGNTLLAFSGTSISNNCLTWSDTGTISFTNAYNLSTTFMDRQGNVIFKLDVDDEKIMMDDKDITLDDAAIAEACRKFLFEQIKNQKG
jgi:hypothetical protein